MQNYRGPQGEVLSFSSGLSGYSEHVRCRYLVGGGYEGLLRRVEDSVSVDKWQDTVEYRTNLDNE